MKEEIRGELLSAGAIAAGFAKAGEVDQALSREFCGWIQDGHAGEMEYLCRHIPLRRDTDNVLPGARTVISLAFSYKPEQWEKQRKDIAAYALAEDYHEAIRTMLVPKIEEFKNKYGGEWRICIDSAPVAERYWAVKSGIGIRSINGNIIIPGKGSVCFLAEILTTLEINPDKENIGYCSRCGKCMEVCPSGALRGDGTMDARKCINYLTIEKKGEFSAEEEAILKQTGSIYGCDRCLRICPHNSEVPATGIEFFEANRDIEQITDAEILSMTPSQFNRLFKHSPMRRTGLKRLKRNILSHKNKSHL